MKSAAFFALLSVLFITPQAQGALVQPYVKPTLSNRFIVEVDDPSLLGSRRRSFEHPLDLVYRNLKSRAVDITVRKEFKADGVFHGASLVIKNAEDVDALRKTPGVKAVRPLTIFPHPRALVAPYVPTAAGYGSVPADPLSAHKLGGVDKVHAEGNTGEGINIGIIDSGIDYDHPFLGSAGFGPGKKIFIGHDFVGNNYDPAEGVLPEPDDDPLDCDGHGTHVAGIIGAVPGNPYNITGVAYGAKLGAYKVFGCSGGTDDEVLVEAMLRADNDGMDVINISLGHLDGWGSSTISVVADVITQKGKVVVIAAGNDGAAGAWYTGGPASAAEVIAVGSVENTLVNGQTATVDGANHDPIVYFSALPLPIKGSLPVFATSTDTTVKDDACKPLPDSTPDLSESLVVIRRGGCPWATKFENIVKKGAKFALIYDNGEGITATASETFSFIRAEDGEFLVQQFATGVKISLSFPQTGETQTFRNNRGGLMSTFSSYGPTYDFKSKPSISAPGGNILSTFPTANGSIAVLSGTSMATPYVSGCAALVLAANGKDAAKGVKTLFETNAKRLAVKDTDGGSLEPVIKGGSGLINVYNAIHAKTMISTGALILNDTAHFQGKQTFEVRNTDSTAQQYTLMHVPALTALTMKEHSILPALGPIPLAPAPATVNIEPPSFTLEPGTAQTITVSVTPPANVDPSRYPLYSGFINVGSGHEIHHVSYLGLAANLKDHQILDDTTEVSTNPFPALVDSSGTKLEAPRNFTFSETDSPTLLFRLAMGSPSVVIDLVDPDFSSTPTGGSFSDVKIVGNWFSVPWIPRNDEDLSAFFVSPFPEAKFADGGNIPNGLYRILLRALKITGDANVADDYESWVSPIFGIFPSS